MITVKRFNPDAAMSISREHAWMRETPEGGHVEYGDYASLFAQFETVKAERDALAVENAALKVAVDGFNQELYGKGFEVLGWHLNGDTEPLDNWFGENDWNPETPATDAALAAIRDKYRAEGINFAANRLLAAFEHGFIDKPAGEVADVAKMILSAVTELPGAPEEGFTRDYSDEVIALIRAELSEAK